MPLTPEQMKKATDFAHKPGIADCPQCTSNNGDISISDRLSFSTPDNGKPTPNTFIAITCNKCGYIRLFSCSIAGIY